MKRAVFSIAVYLSNFPTAIIVEFGCPIPGKLSKALSRDEMILIDDKPGASVFIMISAGNAVRA
jgi:hypothetical protein